MLIVDAGPMIALVDRDDAAHASCVGAAKRANSPAVTTWPAVTEAMHILGNRAGWHGQESLWGMLDVLRIAPVNTPANAAPRMRELMRKYQNVPMDLADASILVLAESDARARVLTLDSDFQIYRLGERRPVPVVPL